MADLYFVGDTIDLAYEVNVDEIAPLKVVEITVSVYTEEGEIIHEDPVTLVNGVVEYTIESAMTKHSGDYMAVFTLRFTEGKDKTFEIPIVVLPRGLSKESIGTYVNMLDEESTDNEVEEAIDRDLRDIRRSGRDAIEGYLLVLQIAQYKTGRRKPR